MSVDKTSSPIKLHRVLIKGLLLFLAINLVFSATTPITLIEPIGFYNWLLPGRTRLPYGDRPELAYNLSLYSLEAMIASHEISGGTKPQYEYRVILIGDSSVWGYLLKPDKTLSALLNTTNLQTKDGRQVRAYNLGYPTMSLTKDLLILSAIIKYQPDLIVWLLTLESFPDSKQLESPIAQSNPRPVRELINTFDLDIPVDDPRFVDLSFMERSLIGQRRPMADILRLQLYGILWAATGIDQYYPEDYEPPQEDLSTNLNFQLLAPPTLSPANLALKVLEAGVSLASPTPILFINEPIYLSQGENSGIRYNFFYPRWAYDQYRVILAERTTSMGVAYADLWDIIPRQEFTNSAIHISPTGEAILAEKVGAAILDIANR